MHGQLVHSQRNSEELQGFILHKKFNSLAFFGNNHYMIDVFSKRKSPYQIFYLWPSPSLAISITWVRHLRKIPSQHQIVIGLILKIQLFLHSVLDFSLLPRVAHLSIMRKTYITSFTFEFFCLFPDRRFFWLLTFPTHHAVIHDCSKWIPILGVLILYFGLPRLC